MTVYYETVPTSFLDRALYLEAERLAFLPSALDQEKFDTPSERWSRTSVTAEGR